VNPDGTGNFIAYLTQRTSVVVQNVTVDNNGQFSASGTEIISSSIDGNVRALDFNPALHPDLALAASGYTLSGQIAGNNVAGQLSGIGASFSGPADLTSGTGQAVAGFYSASALNASSGSTYTVIGGSGQALVVTTTPAAVDGATGTVDATGQLSATTTGGAKITASLSSSSQSITTAVTPAGSSTPVSYSGVSAAVPVANRLVNISTRGFAGTDAQVLIAGFVVTGTTPKEVLIRATGPALVPFGVTGVLANPRLQLFNGANTLLTQNTGWSTAANATAIQQAAVKVGAFTLPTGSPDSSLLVTLDPGNYTAIASGADNGTGVSLVEVYETTSGSNAPKLINISTRGQVNTGSAVMIAGFVVTGNAPKKVLVRASGPALAPFGVTGVLADPVLTLYNSSSVQIAQNDNWGSAGDGTLIAAAAAQVGAFALPTGSKDAVLLLNLQPGAYTAVASGSGNTTGVALIEVYEVP
jgi:hypothetical protein